MSSFFGQAGESHDTKLTEQEIKAVAKLLSDPTYFPVEFRTWLKNYIESAGISINASQIRGEVGGSVSLPPGIILPYASMTVAPNVLVCDGSLVSRTFYDTLFEAIGTFWGVGDGATTFAVPDLRDRALYGVGTRIGIAATDGVASGSRGGPDHHHDISFTSGGGSSHGHGGSISGGGHEHNFPNNYDTVVLEGTAGGTHQVADDAYFTATTSGGGGHSHTLSINNESGHTHGISGITQGSYGLRPSFAGVRYVITTGKAA